jgi:excisionase family DNA binding protein
VNSIDPGAFDRARDRLKELSPPPEYLTVQEVAELARCGHKAVRRAITLGQLEAFRTAERILVREPDARAWIEARPVRATPGRQRSSTVAQMRAMQKRSA